MYHESYVNNSSLQINKINFKKIQYDINTETHKYRK